MSGECLNHGGGDSDRWIDVVETICQFLIESVDELVASFGDLNPRNTAIVLIAYPLDEAPLGDAINHAGDVGLVAAEFGSELTQCWN